MPIGGRIRKLRRKLNESSVATIKGSPLTISKKGKGVGKNSIKFREEESVDDIREVTEESINTYEPPAKKIKRRQSNDQATPLIQQEDDIIFKKPVKPVSSYKKKKLPEATAKTSTTGKSAALHAARGNSKSALKHITKGVKKQKIRSTRKHLRSAEPKRKSRRANQWNWTEVLLKNPETIIYHG